MLWGVYDHTQIQIAYMRSVRRLLGKGPAIDNIIRTSLRSNNTNTGTEKLPTPRLELIH